MAYKFRLKPNAEQMRQLERYVGASRFLWNKVLGMNLSRLENKQSLLWYYEADYWSKMWKSIKKLKADSPPSHCRTGQRSCAPPPLAIALAPPFVPLTELGQWNGWTNDPTRCSQWDAGPGDRDRKGPRSTGVGAPDPQRGVGMGSTWGDSVDRVDSLVR